jgi:hypothetical protein
MSYPFLIWTLQRTGGTALTDLLMLMSEHRSADHEPFNWARVQPRQFFPIVDAWNKTKDNGQLRAALEAVCEDRYLIKHCFELHAPDFNRQLMKVANAKGYMQLLLLRRNEYARLISKFIAESHGTWFEDYARKVFDEVSEGQRSLRPIPTESAVKHYRKCQNKIRLLRKSLSRLGVNVYEVYYEDLYSGEAQARRERALRLLAFLGFTSAEIEFHSERIDHTLFDRGQDTGSMSGFVPNLGEVRAALLAAGCRVE